MTKPRRRAKTTTIIAAMRILQRDIQSEDGIATAAIGEAADRLEEMRLLLLQASNMPSAPCAWPARLLARVRRAAK